jgi:hypothetical protein
MKPSGCLHDTQPILNGRPRGGFYVSDRVGMGGSVSDHSAIGPTAEQIAAIRRIELGLVKIYQANEKINQIITHHSLESQFGIVRLSSHPQGLTMGTIAEAMRVHQGAFMLDKLDKVAA